jgi:ABC-type Zn uptake system ZnuABC Zn-binding protein ZnuA
MEVHPNGHESERSLGMKNKPLLKLTVHTLILTVLTSTLFISIGYSQSTKPIQVCATVPDLGSLTQELGGDQVSVTIFAKGKEDPHFVEAKPSFIKALSQADLYLQIGMELEIGWAPVLLQNARNGQVLPGAKGYMDISTIIKPLEVPAGPVDRAMGDVHPLGNPHYLLDPLNALRTAQFIRDRLIGFRPEKKSFFEDRFDSFRKRLGNALVGEKLAIKYEFEKLTILFEQEKLGSFLKEQKEESLLGGWLGMVMPYSGAKIVADHNQWPYFARRFGISVIGFLEPKPGLSPTTRHLQALVERMKSEGVKVIITSPYFDIRHAQFVSKNTGAKIVPLAHQVGARPDTDDYIKMIDYNVKQLVMAFGGRP